MTQFGSDSTDPEDGKYTWSNFGGLFDMPETYQIFYFINDGDTEEVSAQVVTTVFRQKEGGNAPPAPVELVFPADGALVSTQTFFSWTRSSDPDSDAVTYRIELATDEAFTENFMERRYCTDVCTS